MKIFYWIKSFFTQSSPQDEPTKTMSFAFSRDRVAEFTELRLGGQDAPKDLSVLLNAILGNPEFEDSDNNPLKLIGVKILWVDRKYPLLDHTYINDTDRADPSIMANIKAMQDTDKKMKFVIQCEDTSLLGYWQPDPEIPLEQCPLFWLDTALLHKSGEGFIL